MSKFSRWSGRLGTPNQHNASLPRDFWLEDWEKAAIIAFHALYPLEGYRRLAYMMLDADVVAVSPSSVYRVLRAAGKLAPRGGKPSKKGQGFEQPLRPHEHWHIDVSYLNVCGTFFFLCSILDGYSRFVIHWEIRETMKEAEVETIIQRAREQYPGEQPRIISDNGPQFIARDFKEFIRICGMTHVRTSPFYPQSNGKIERWFKTLKGGCIREGGSQNLCANLPPNFCEYAPGSDANDRSDRRFASQLAANRESPLVMLIGGKVRISREGAEVRFIDLCATSLERTGRSRLQSSPPGLCFLGFDG